MQLESPAAVIPQHGSTRLSLIEFMICMGHGLQNAMSKSERVTSHWQVGSFSSRCFLQLCDHLAAEGVNWRSPSKAREAGLHLSQNMATAQLGTT